MGAREDLLAAAESLADSGMALFCPAELIAKARSQGSTYSDSMLRTHIVSVMCGNAPDHHSTKYRDFERVARALYGLTPDRPSAAPVAIALPRVAQDQFDAGPELAGGATVEPGDLIFFGSGRSGVDHVGLYVGAGEMIDAPHTGALVRFDHADWSGLVGATRPG